MQRVWYVHLCRGVVRAVRGGGGQSGRAGRVSGSPGESGMDGSRCQHWNVRHPTSAARQLQSHNTAAQKDATHPQYTSLYHKYNILSNMSTTSKQHITIICCILLRPNQGGDPAGLTIKTASLVLYNQGKQAEQA